MKEWSSEPRNPSRIEPQRASGCEFIGQCYCFSASDSIDHLDVIKTADHVINLGPVGGRIPPSKRRTSTRATTRPIGFLHIFRDLDFGMELALTAGVGRIKAMKKLMLATMLLTGGSLFAAPRVAIGIGLGVPAPVAVVRPVCPGPGYVWVDGYYAPNRVWVAGYWAPPIAVRVAPRIERAPVVVGARRFDFDRRHDFRR
jgi:hypothetical protein